MATCTVSGTFLDSSGTAVSGASVHFNTESPAIDSTGNVVMPKELLTTTAANGTWSLNITQGVVGNLTLDLAPTANSPIVKYNFSLIIPLSTTATFQSCWVDSANFGGQTGSGGTSVTSLNSLTGAVTLVAGSNVTITQAGNNLTIASTGGGGGSGITSINADTTAAQTIVSGTSGNDFAVSTAAGATTISLPSASATARGAVTTGTQTFAGNKTFSGTVSASNISGTNTGDQTITLTGGVTGSGTGSFAATVVTNANLTGPVTSTGNTTAIANGAITNAMLANAAVASLSGTNTGDQTITLTGDVTGSGPGSFAATIPNGTVTNAKSANMAAHTYKGNNTGSTAAPADITSTQLTADLNAFVGDSGAGGTKGMVPAPAAGDAAAGKFLKADGTFAVPAGAGGITGPGTTVVGDIAVWNSTTGVALKDVSGATIDASANLSATAFKIAGTAGSGFDEYISQSSAPSTPASNAVRMFSDASGRPSFKRSDAFVRSLDGTTTADRVYTLPDTTGTVLMDSFLFGDGSDGNVTISSGTTTLTTDKFYNNLTLSGTGVLAPVGFRVFVNGTLDITACAAGAIRFDGASGSNATGATFGGAGGITAGVTIGGNSSPGTSVSGTTGVGAQASAPSAVIGNGGSGGSCGAGGSGTSGAGGASRTAGALTAVPFRRLSSDLLRGVALIVAGGGNPGASSGAGDGTVSGGGGGGGGSSGGIILLFARTISRGGSTSAAGIRAIGGNGGVGGTPAGGNCGGGGGGSGPGGGWIYLAYQTLTGSTATNVLATTGGNGGNGGAGTGTGTGGNGGGSGSGGRITVIDFGKGTLTETSFSNAVAGGAASGTTGGTGATATASQVSL